MTFFQCNATVLYIEIGVLAFLVSTADFAHPLKTALGAVSIGALLSAGLVLNAQHERHRPLRAARQELRIAQLAHRLGPSGIPSPDQPLLQRLRDGQPVSVYAEKTLYRQLQWQRAHALVRIDRMRARSILARVLPASLSPLQPAGVSR